MINIPSQSKELQNKYNTTFNESRNGIIKKAFEFFMSLDYLKGHDAERFENMFDEKQQKHIDKVMEMN